MPKKPTSKKAKQPDDRVARPPVIVVLGHIDHGKTTLLDSIRKSRVAAKEAGGITQSIGAYQVELRQPGRKGIKSSTRLVTFIDTPGHAAFSKMRERGAGVADIAVLVVAANDGVKPQTVEAIAHAKAAGVPVVVALNKIDLLPVGERGVSSKVVIKVGGQLAKEGIVSEDQGGESPVVPVSAKTGKGIPELLEMVGIVADLLELKADSKGEFKAVVIESFISPKQGPLATLIVKEGTLKVKDQIFAANVEGKVKALVDDQGRRLSEIGPGSPAQVLGFSEAPPIGAVVGRVGEGLVKREEEEIGSKSEPSVERGVELLDKKDLNLVLRTDAEGSLEAISGALENLRVEDRGVNLLLKGIGPVGDSDARLAAAAQGLILGFNVSVIPSAQKLADDLGVGVRSFSIIYKLLETVEKLLAGAKVLEEKAKPPEAEVLKVFTLHSGDLVAGVKVLNGKFKYRDRVGVVRDDEEIHRGMIRGLRIGADEVPKVDVGDEAGVLIKPGFEFKKGDRLVINFKK